MSPQHAQLIERMRGFAVDHTPDGWPGVRMREVTALCDIIDTLRTGHTPDHDPDSELALACASLKTIELLLCQADFDDGIGGGLAEIIEPIRARIERARIDYRMTAA